MDDPWMLWKYGGECTCVCARVFVVGGVAACFRWKDSCAYRIEGAR